MRMLWTGLSFKDRSDWEVPEDQKNANITCLQEGQRKGSTELHIGQPHLRILGKDNLIILTSFVEDARTVNDVYFDFSRAFDVVFYNILIDRMLKYQSNRWTVIWTANWLNSCAQIFINGTTSRSRLVKYLERWWYVPYCLISSSYLMIQIIAWGLIRRNVTFQRFFGSLKTTNWPWNSSIPV